MVDDQVYRDKEDYIHELDLEHRKGHLYHTIIQEYLPFIKKNVIHAGCNSGSTTKLISLYIKNTVGVDINPNAIAYARKRYPSIQFDIANLTNLPYNDNIFEGAYYLDILEHIYSEDMANAVFELHRVLKPNAYACIFIPAPTSCTYIAPEHVFLFKDHDVIYNILDKYFEIVEIIHDTRDNPGLPGHQDHWRVLCRNFGD